MKDYCLCRSYRFSIIIPLLICVSLIFLLSEKALSWSTPAHVSMTNTASRVLSKMLNDKFDKQYLAKLPLDVLEPDVNRVVDHIDIYQCASMINTLANKAERLLHKDEDWSKILFLMAQAAHYIEDLNNPHHCIRYEKGYHEEFEKIATSGYWIDEDYDGFHYVRDYKIFAKNACGFSRRYLKFTYKLHQGYDSDYYRKLIIPLWTHTVNDVLDLWLTILWNGLGDRDYRTYGLPEPKGIRDDKKIRFEKIRDL